MEASKVGRRGFLGRVAAALGGFAALPALAQPAQAGRSWSRRRYRGGWDGGWRRRSWSRSRFRYRGPGYGPWYYGGYGYGGYGYGGYGYGYPRPRVYIAPRPYYAPPPPAYYGRPPIYLPLSGPGRPIGIDPLSLLEV